MSDHFDYDSDFSTAQAMSWVDMPELGERARILLRPATQEGNPAYYNAMLRLSGKRARQLARSGTISVADLEKNRLDDRQLFPKFIIESWEHVETREDRGRPFAEKEFVPFNREAATELCEKLPAHLFDRIRNHAATEENFYPEEQIPPDAEDLVGN
jgi:hypothetical protein